MKALLLTTTMIVFTLNIKAQNHSRYSEYMYNAVSFNPGSAGAEGVPNVFMSYSAQWIGLEGAPETLSISFQTPVGPRGNGIGINILKEAIGPSTATTINLNYAYTIEGSDKIKYSFGLAAGFQQLDIDFTKLNIADSELDMQGKVSSFEPNIGAGIYLHTNKWFAGVSVPRLLRTKIHENLSAYTNIGRLHLFLTGGYEFPISEELKFNPIVLINAVAGSPVSIDMSFNFKIHHTALLGVSLGNSNLSGLVTFQISKAFQIGYSYRHEIQEFGSYNFASHELFLKLNLFDLTHI